MKSFLSGRTQVPASTLQPLADAPSAAIVRTNHSHSSPGPSTAATPSVECIKSGDKVVRLVVTCSCGEKIEIECLYPAGG